MYLRHIDYSPGDPDCSENYNQDLEPSGLCNVTRLENAALPIQFLQPRRWCRKCPDEIQRENDSDSPAGNDE